MRKKEQRLKKRQKREREKWVGGKVCERLDRKGKKKKRELISLQVMMQRWSRARDRGTVGLTKRVGYKRKGLSVPKESEKSYGRGEGD